VLKEKIIFINLRIKKIKKFFYKNNVIRKWKWGSINFIVVQILLALLLSNLLYYCQEDAVFFSDVVRLLLVVNQVGISAFFAVEIAKLADAF